MNFNHLEYAAAVAKYRSISKASQNLLLSQPYLSSMIRSLEEELGYKIFDRTPTGVTLTPEGEQFLVSSKHILLELRKIRDIKAPDNDQNLNISCYYATYVMEMFLKFRNLSPVRFPDKLKEMGTREVMDSVVSGDSRIGIIFYADECQELYTQQAKDLGLHIHQLFPPMKVYAICSQNHALSALGHLSTADLIRYPYVCYDDSSSQSYLQVLGLKEHPQLLEVSDRGSFYDALRSGEYLSVMAFQNPPKEEGLMILPFDDKEHLLLSCYLTSKNYKPNKREKEFLMFLKTKKF